MKIEKISDNQIRCTLNKDDLIDRQLRISELAYGTEKAKALFKEMMQQASAEFGFEADDIPLMIEAIPVSSDCLILVITKVEDPDELDTRFSKFSPDTEQSPEADDSSDTYVNEIINCFDQINEILDEKNLNKKNNDNSNNSTIESETSEDNIETEEPDAKKAKTAPVKANLTKVFSFHSLEDIINLASHLQYNYKGINSLYKNPDTGLYYLCVNKSEHTPEEFNKVCNIISEYGKIERTTYASLDYFKEHYICIIADNAINILAQI